MRGGRRPASPRPRLLGPAVLRRLSAVVLAALASVGTAAAPAAAETVVDPRTWSSQQLAAQLVHSCVDLHDTERGRRHAGAGIGGITLLGSGASSALASSLASVRAAAPGGLVPFVASDEEGGAVQRLASAIYRLPPAATMGGWDDARIEQTAHDYGVRMRELGVPMALAPVADLGVPGYYVHELRRAFSGDPARVTTASAAWSRGVQRAGVVPVLKHWPGHGQASDSHTTAPVVPPRSTLEGRDMVPFDAAFRAGVPIVMVGHLRSEGLTEPGVPATLSPSALRYLRERVGPSTVVVTDSLSMAASSSALRISPERAAVRSLAAGADWALTCVPDPLPTVAAVRAAIDDGTLPRARAEASVRRVLALKEAAGLLPGPLVTAAPVGSLDEVATRDGWVRARGWALDPDTRDPAAVAVRVDGTEVSVAPAAQPRPDVAALHVGHGEGHGFDVALSLPAGPHEVCVAVRNTGRGDGLELGCRTVDVGPAPELPLADECADAEPAEWSDVPPDAWYGPALSCAAAAGVVRGVDDDRYAPGLPMTRAQMASLVQRLRLRSGPAPTGAPDAFSDDDGSVHEAAIDSLAQLGVVTGTAPGRFSPSTPVTRAQAVALLVRLRERIAGELPAGAPGFEDLAGSPHSAAIGKAHAAGIATGTTPWQFTPGAPVRRDAVAVLAARAMRHLPAEGAGPSPAVLTAAPSLRGALQDAFGVALVAGFWWVGGPER